MKLVLTIATAVAVILPAAAQQAAPTPAPAKKPASERLICHEEEEIGSRVHSKRVCMTSSQWREQAARQGQDLERREIQRSGASSGQ